MTHQTELYDDAQRLNDDVAQAMQEFNQEHEGAWGVEYEIPKETNGWTYIGDGGALATTASWVDEFPNPNKTVSVIINSTHPRSDNCDRAEVNHVADMENKIDSKTQLETFDGESYKTPLHVSRKIFWDAVNEAIEWMEENPP